MLDDYADEGPRDIPFPSGHRITNHHRMLSTTVNELLDAGFTVERVAEPQATEEARHIDERRYLKTRQTPFFLAVRMRKTR